jgi:Phage integrase SAM-like domain
MALLRKSATKSRMNVAKPRGMFLRGAVWWARKDVPENLRSIIGVTSLQRSLETSDLALAKIAHHGVMQEFEARIEHAKRQAAGQAEPIIMIPVPDRWQASLAKAEQMKPENQIRRMLEQAKMIGPAKKGPKLDTVFEEWVKERKPTQNTQAEYERAKQIFITLNGNHPINEYTTEHARKWKQYVVDQTNNGKALAHATREKTFGAVTTLFRYADRNDWLTANPFAKIGLERPKRAKTNRRQEWDRHELKKLFGSPVYTKGKRFKSAGGEAAYWLPVLALYHGFRAGEHSASLIVPI